MDVDVMPPTKKSYFDDNIYLGKTLLRAGECHKKMVTLNSSSIVIAPWLEIKMPLDSFVNMESTTAICLVAVTLQIHWLLKAYHI